MRAQIARYTRRSKFQTWKRKKKKKKKKRVTLLFLPATRSSNIHGFTLNGLKVLEGAEVDKETEL